jgi:hypothetical protein
MDSLRSKAWATAGQHIGVPGVTHVPSSSLRIIDDLISSKLSPEDTARLSALEAIRSCALPPLHVPCVLVVSHGLRVVESHSSDSRMRILQPAQSLFGLS